MRVLYHGRIGNWKCWFLWREENRRTRRKSLGARSENSTYRWHQAGIEPGPHWWEASALDTAQSLLPKPILNHSNPVRKSITNLHSISAIV